VARGKEVSGFDFTAAMRRLCDDFCQRLPELRHVDLDRVALGFCQTRQPVQHGIQATLTPLRFEQGSLTTRRRGRTWTIERLVDRSGREFLYLLRFYLPRFLDLPLEEKLITICHELWHISPAFDGDLRRHPGRCYAHSSSQAEYDAAMAVLVEQWRRLDPPRELYDFLRYRFQELQTRHGSIRGHKIRVPRLRPLDAA
jgi:hypothetical protein